jgi:hypothetical protein
MLGKNYRKTESDNLYFWKKQLCIFFLKHYQISREKHLLLMNSDIDYINVLKIELSKPIGIIKRKIIIENEKKNIINRFSNDRIQIRSDILNEIKYFINDINSENEIIRSVPVI